ncbi:Xaa-Pro aminopeptidase [Aestuariibacter halophilus]|uniref:Xaa-Pro aminopeptidase n=1 Tax=Fluctibacter halophilus TaxID=226011 RepID=A0ABS8G7J7_9ALTE|nr:Xaa-Pro aminopeptidase [Aestuariibacter halophilus]MCC2616498.1 Xaa-Pro aminopeptidase [Aestuariibacter halophilus]
MIATAEFAARRRALLDKLAPDSLLVMPAGRLVTRSNDTEYPFRQHSDFHYLTGFPEPDAWLLLSNHPRHQDAATVLLCLDKDPMAEIWHGRRIGPEQAAEQFGVDLALSISDLDEILFTFMDGHRHLYVALGDNEHADAVVMDALNALRQAPKQSRLAPQSLIDWRPLVHEMRLFKSDGEIAVMERAAQLSAEAHVRAMRFCAPGKHEYQLAGELHHTFAMGGAAGPAYGTIVGSGDNACILHYTENSDALTDGDLVLIDAGAELAGYAADITRTFPVNGRFSPEQKALYQWVLDAQLASMALLKPGNTLKQATDKAIEVLTTGLIELGLLHGDVQDNIGRQTYRQFFMHGLGHWLGLDVHDVGAYKVDGQDRPLQAGMVLTVEPGLYIAPDAEVDPRWRGIGIRIEDNVVITADGHRVITDGVPKAVDEIERLMAEAKD